eukprot:311389-Chlamydomonas_euryale.AAC.2
MNGCWMDWEGGGEESSNSRSEQRPRVPRADDARLPPAAYAPAVSAEKPYPKPRMLFCLLAQSADPLLLGYTFDAAADAQKLKGPLAMLLEELPDPLVGTRAGG